MVRAVSCAPMVRAGSRAPMVRAGSRAPMVRRTPRVHASGVVGYPGKTRISHHFTGGVRGQPRCDGARGRPRAEGVRGQPRAEGVPGATPDLVVHSRKCRMDDQFRGGGAGARRGRGGGGAGAGRGEGGHQPRGVVVVAGGRAPGVAPLYWCATMNISTLSRLDDSGFTPFTSTKSDRVRVRSAG